MHREALERERDYRKAQVQKRIEEEAEAARLMAAAEDELSEEERRIKEFELAKQARLEKLLPYTDESLCCLERDNGFRAVMISCIESPSFDNVFLFVILVNCVTMAMYDPYDTECTKFMCKILAIVELAVFGLFALEMLIKIVAMGLYGRGSYLADHWNKLDFFIVLSAAVDLASPGEHHRVCEGCHSYSSWQGIWA